jgi:FtsH-binding integral membrane protein
MKKIIMSIRTVIGAITFFLVFFSCKKDDNNSATKTKTELLTAGPWKYIASTITPAYDYYGDGVMATNIFAIMKACEKDDFETYQTNGMWEYNEGSTKCDPS